MTICVFLSFPTPHLAIQKAYIAKVEAYIRAQGLTPCTLGTSNYDMDAPLAGIRRLMVGCCGLLCVAFKRSHAARLEKRAHADLPSIESSVDTNVWLTSPYSQIEPAMAFQLGLPILILREQGVLAEGVLEKGVTGFYCPEFISSEDEPFEASNSKSIVDQWIGRVRSTYEMRGAPVRIY